jgi:diguanylate cyclase (GGDEF)-like protein
VRTSSVVAVYGTTGLTLGLVVGLGHDHQGLLVVLGATAVCAQVVAGVKRDKDLVRARRQANTDALTGLANRRAVIMALRAQPNIARPVGVLLVDLDDFKGINDTYGHLVGDEVLQVVARRLSDAANAAGLAARLGGDEFAVLVHDVDRANLLLLAQQLRTALAEPVEVGPFMICVQASIGTAVRRADDYTMADVLRRADIAMYRAKGRSGTPGR